jgi:hypothetical protein
MDLVRDFNSNLDYLFTNKRDTRCEVLRENFIPEVLDKDDREVARDFAEYDRGMEALGVKCANVRGDREAGNLKSKGLKQNGRKLLKKAGTLLYELEKQYEACVRNFGSNSENFERLQKCSVQDVVEVFRRRHAGEKARVKAA